MQIAGSQIDLARDRAPFPSRGVGGERAVDRERAHREQVAFAGDHPRRRVARSRGRGGHRGDHRGALADGAGHGHLVEGLECGVDGREVPGDHRLAQPPVGLHDRVLDRRDRILDSITPASAKKQVCSTVFTASRGRPPCHAVAVDDEQPRPSRRCDAAPRPAGAARPPRAEWAVQQEGRARRRDLKHRCDRAARTDGGRRSSPGGSNSWNGSVLARTAGARP